MCTSPWELCPSPQNGTCPMWMARQECKAWEELDIFKTCFLFRMSFQSVHICAALVFHHPALSGTALPKNQVHPIFSFSLSWSMAFTNWGGFLGTQQHFSEGMKAPIYNLLHVCNYPDHQRWEKNINPQTFVGPCLKWSHAFPRPRASGLCGSVCEFAVMAHLPVSDIILNLSGLPSVKAMSFEPLRAPLLVNLGFWGWTCPRAGASVSIQDNLPLQASRQ